MFGRKVFIIVWSLLLFVASSAADEIDDLRRQLPQLKDSVLLKAYEKMYSLTQQEENFDLQKQVLYEWLDEALRQHNIKFISFVMVNLNCLYYNNDINDSVYARAPQDMKYLKQHKVWDRYFEIWAYLVNTYIYSGKANIGLHEVQTMFEEAATLKDNYGMGLAYVGMGNAYQVLGSLDESAKAYRRGINILQKLPIPSSVLAEVYPNYADVLNDQHAYDELERLTDEWANFVQRLLIGKKDILGDDSYQTDAFWSYYYLARVQAFLGKGELGKASAALDEVGKRLVSENDYLGQKFLFYKAQLCLLRGNYNEALSLNTRRMQLMESSDDKSVLIMVHQQRAEIMEKLGRYAEAARLYHSMYIINDSINARDIKNQLTEMNTLFQVDELKMAQERETAQLKMKQQRTMYVGVIAIASIVMLAMLIFLVFRIKAAKRLKIAHDKLEQTHSELLTAYDNLEETTKAKERIESDLRIARDIQMSMVPGHFPERPDLDIFASMTPAKEVGGDLYDFLLIGDHLYFCLGDVSGKGVPASLFMAQATRLFHTLAKLEMKPAEIATRLNDELGADNDQGMFVTMFLGVADLATGHLDFCNAGHNPPVLVADEGCHFLEMIPNAPIGLWPGLDYEGEAIDDITGKPLFIYTDGLNEAENRQQAQFTDERLLELLQDTPYQSARQTIDLLVKEVEKHRDGAEPNDDLTMLCFRINHHT